MRRVIPMGFIRAAWGFCQPTITRAPRVAVERLGGALGGLRPGDAAADPVHAGRRQSSGGAPGQVPRVGEAGDLVAGRPAADGRQLRQVSHD